MVVRKKKKRIDPFTVKSVPVSTRRVAVEIYQRPSGDWFVRVTGGKRAWATIVLTREEARMQAVLGVQWVLERLLPAEKPLPPKRKTVKRKR